MLASTLLFGVAVSVLDWAGREPAVIYLAIGGWGLAFGGVATLVQAALAKTAGDAADVAQSMLVTTWNLAISGGGLVGGVLLERFGVSAFAPTLLALLVVAWGIVWSARHHGFSAP